MNTERPSFALCQGRTIGCEGYKGVTKSLRSFMHSTSFFMKTDTEPEITEASSLWGGFQPKRAAPLIKDSGRKPLLKRVSKGYSFEILVPLSLTRCGI